MARKSLEIVSEGYLRAGGINSLTLALRGLLSTLLPAPSGLGGLVPIFMRRRRNR